MSEQDGKSLRWIVTASLVLIVVIGWGSLASSYAGAVEGTLPTVGSSGRMTVRGRGVAMLISATITFLWNAVAQLPNFFSVISWHCSNRVWLPILFIVLGLAVVAGAWGLKKLEDNLSKPGYRPKKRK
jgi:uncharacterized membrane protein YhdT